MVSEFVWKQSSSKAQGGVEVRRLHVIYFLCRKGRIEDPHLIRVHHLSRNGIHLRDIKRWLAELRGRDMPESFAWAYKRKYMKGYVWQDLVDDDLITPHFNNEYVLKGSEISCQDTKQTEGYVSMQTDRLLEEAKEKPSPEESLIKRTSSREIEEELPESTLTDDFMKVEEEKNLDTIEQRISKEFNKVGESYTSLYLDIFNKKAKKMSEGATTMENAKPSDNSSSTKSKRNGNVKTFRNIITCRGAETNDSVISLMKNCSGEEKNECVEISKLHQRVNVKYSMNLPRHGASCNGEPKSTSFCSPRKSSAAYLPTCSQCGKQFYPQKLHLHMKSCKGMKAIGKASYPASAAAKNRSRTQPNPLRSKLPSDC